MQKKNADFGDYLLERYRCAARAGRPSSFALKIGGHSVGLSFADGDLARALTPSLGCSAAPAESSLPATAAYLWRDPEFFRSHALIAQFKKYPDRASVSNNGEAHLLYNPEGDFFCFIDTSSDHAFYCVSDAADLPDYEVCTPMRMLFHWICVKAGLVFVHAAAVGYRGRGALLIGRGGSGKSTTALACLTNGLEFAGDDYTAVRAAENPTAYSLYRGCKITGEMLPLFPSLSGCVIETRRTGDKNVAILTEGQGSLAPSLGIRAVIRPRVCLSEKTVFKKTPSVPVLMEAATSTVLQIQGGGDYTLKGLAAVFRKTPAYVMELSADLREIADGMRDFLENLNEGGDKA